MILRIARKEFTEMRRDGRVPGRVCAGLGSILTATLLLAALAAFKRLKSSARKEA